MQLLSFFLVTDERLPSWPLRERFEIRFHVQSSFKFGWRRFYGLLPGNAISVFERIARSRCDDSLHWIQDKKTAPPWPMSLAGGAVKSIPALQRWPAGEEVSANWQG